MGTAIELDRTKFLGFCIKYDLNYHMNMYINNTFYQGGYKCNISDFLLYKLGKLEKPKCQLG